MVIIPDINLTFCCVVGRLCSLLRVIYRRGQCVYRMGATKTEFSKITKKNTKQQLGTEHNSNALNLIDTSKIKLGKQHLIFWLENRLTVNMSLLSPIPTFSGVNDLLAVSHGLVGRVCSLASSQGDLG